MSGTRHLEFAPPATPGMVRAVLLALVAHLALVAVLAIGVAWKRETPPVAVEAELWATVPQEAAPLPPEPEHEPPEPEPEPPLPVRPAPPPAPPVVDTPKAADIALAKEKEKARLQKEKELQQAKLEQERKAQQDKLQRDKLAQEKQRKEQETKVAREKAEKAEKADKAKAEALAKQKATKAAELAAQKNRDDQLKRMAALAGGETTGSGGAGSAAKSAGPGASYFGRVAARIKPNVTYTDIISGNPITEIEVSLSPSGDILSRRISKRSGNTAWDNAALNAIDKTEKLPLDNGKVWSPLVIVLSPQTLLGP
ncbi:cell envelope integrity protein TolA [Rhodoferax sp. TS-BS-61-7]|uniref:cell envelope integrity protein TolA n=1 Tax=Rhodoferax sp. TS-BS-61-7 TaxID=2094194 RepID=UPI000CF6051D|nr:cell envelope integrity protein TolA [Rhodoferax sp. TS-BS-61-7]PQA77967.1 cell envelope integrity protein TolA [Rhodoferax sp. TS-BS-61-7]